MIRKLKIKVTILSITSIFILLTFIVVGMNIINYKSVVDEADEILSILSLNRGRFPVNEEMADPEHIHDDLDEDHDHMNKFEIEIYPELPYELRYFSVYYSSDGTVYHDVSKIASVDTEMSEDYAKAALEENDERGFVGDYRYLVIEGENGTRIFFLNLDRNLNAFRKFLFSSLSMAVAGFLVVVLVIVFVSGRIIRPIAESYEKQKRFITDAGHEIKTPLTIINANADVLEMEIGPNESLADIHEQTHRLTELTNRLVYLAKMEEGFDSHSPMTELSLSGVVEEISNSFETLAKSEGKTLTKKISENISVMGDIVAVGRLVSILLDNAVKYSTSDSEIEVSVSKQGRNALLSVSNVCREPMDQEQISHIFERFYRTDESRNSSTGGHGIGLSMAKAIMTQHGGKIGATIKDGERFVITAVFSAN